MGFNTVPVGIPIVQADAKQPIAAALQQPAAATEQLAFLSQRGYPAGLASEIVKCARSCPLRVWIVDDSGSMRMGDGTSVKQGKIINCTRATELAATVLVQAELAAALGTRCVFQTLNGPCLTVDGTQGKDAAAAGVTALHNVFGTDGLASGSTPLTEAVVKTISLIEPMVEQLRATGQRAVVVLATDGRPNNPTTFKEALRRLQELPVLITIRLCTSEEGVLSYWTDLDAELERPLDVLDDLSGEAAEVAQAQPWLAYLAPLHEAREFGLSHKLFDLLDEAPLLPTQCRALLELLFGGPLPEPQLDFAAFEQAVLAHAAAAGAVFCPLQRRCVPWVDAAKLAANVGPKLRLRMRGEKLKKLELFSQSDPFVRVSARRDAPLGQTEHVDNEANPRWRELVLTQGGLAGDAHLCFEVFDHESSGKHRLIGSVTARLDELLAGKLSRAELEKDGKKGRGALVFDGVASDV